MKRSYEGLALFGAASALTLAIGGVAVAAAPAPVNQLGDVIVTARRVSENNQKVPIAITALSQASLIAHGVNKFDELVFAAPALVFDSDVTRNAMRVTLRGQSQAYGSDFPGVDTLFAEVPIAPGAQVNLFDVQSVQVLEGPQGVAFGRNSTGGSVLITPVPPRNNFEGFIEAAYGNFNDRHITAVVNVPIVPDKLMIRADVDVEKRDGWSLNLTDGHHLDARNNANIRFSVLWRPTANIEDRLVISNTTVDTDAGAIHLTHFFPGAGLGAFYGPAYIVDATEALALGRDKERLTTDGYVKTEQLLVSNITTVDFNEHIRLKNIFGAQYLRQANSWDQDGVQEEIIQLGDPTPQYNSNLTLSDEIQLQGSYDEGRLRWLVGLYASKQDPASKVLPGDAFVGVGTFLFAGPQVTSDAEHTTSLAPYAQITLPVDFISQKLSFTAGARYTMDHRKDLAFREQAGMCTFVDGSCSIALDGKFSGFNYAFTLNYQFNNQLLAYFTRSHGFKGGSFNPASPDPTLLLVQPEYVDNNEFGLKSQWSLGPIQGRTNLALFWEDYTSIVRTSYVIVGTQIAAVNRNAADATIRGGEIQFDIIPFRGLDISGFYSLTDAYFTKSIIPQYIVTYKNFPDVPRDQAGVTVNYQFPLNENVGQVSVSGSFVYKGRHAVDQSAANPLAYEPGYWLGNARIDWRHIMGSSVDAAFWIKNLWDQHYLLGGGDLTPFGYIHALYGEPRTFGVTLRYSFGH